jgi:hypothetical protein
MPAAVLPAPQSGAIENRTDSPRRLETMGGIDFLFISKAKNDGNIGSI